jgi:hypothetical protein
MKHVTVKDTWGLKKGTGASGLKFLFFGGWAMLFALSFTCFASPPFSLPHSTFFYFYSWVPLEFSQCWRGTGKREK